jgi:hypothetical protein
MDGNIRYVWPYGWMVTYSQHRAAPVVTVPTVVQSGRTRVVLVRQVGHKVVRPGVGLGQFCGSMGVYFSGRSLVGDNVEVFPSCVFDRVKARDLCVQALGLHESFALGVVVPHRYDVVLPLCLLPLRSQSNTDRC